MSLKATSITTTVNGGEDRTANGVTASLPNEQPLLSHQITLSDGTGAGKAQRIGYAPVSLTNGASVTFDLTAFPAGPYANVNFSSIKDCLFHNSSTNATDVWEVGNDGTVANAWTAPFAGTNARVKAGPGGTTHIPAPLGGLTVDATHKNLMVKNTGTNTVSGSIIMFGEGT